MIARRPLLAGLGLGLLAAGPLVPLMFSALDRLAAARATRDALAASVASPARATPLVARAARIDAPDAARAQAQLLARVQQLARRGGVLVERATPIAAPAGLAVVRIRLSGPEKAVVALADTLERDPPLLRFLRWRIEPVAGGVRLSGDLVGAWR